MEFDRVDVFLIDISVFLIFRVISVLCLLMSNFVTLPCFITSLVTVVIVRYLLGSRNYYSHVPFTFCLFRITTANGSIITVTVKRDC